MKRTLPILLAFSLLGALVIGAIWSPAASAHEEKVPGLLRPYNQEQLHGWQVCAIGGIGSVPGVGNRQMIELCHSDGWRIMTYCLNPGQPVPELGAFCSQTSPGIFWCGEGVQEVKQLSVLETPGPRDTAAPTRTLTPTTPVRTATVTPTNINLPAPSATAFSRPRAGGLGNVEVGLVILWGIVLAATGGWILKHWNTPGQNQRG